MVVITINATAKNNNTTNDATNNGVTSESTNSGTGIGSIFEN